VSNRNYRNHRGRDHNRRERYTPPHVGKRHSNLTVVPRQNEPIERAIRRFIKKCKKMKIIETYREKTDYYEKPSVVRRKKAIRRQRAIDKANKANANR
jgi:ribosomal protein S21